MKSNLNGVYCTLLCAALFQISGCIIVARQPGGTSYTPPSNGDAGTAFDPTRFDFYRDDRVIGGLVNLIHGDVLTSAADQSKIPLSDFVNLILGKLDREGYLEDGDAGSVGKTCKPWSEGRSILVTSQANVGRRYQKKINNGNSTGLFEMEVNSYSERNWSRTDGESISCDKSVNDAKINFASPAGTRLELSYDRTRPETRKITGSPKITAFKTVKAKGTSVVTWSSNDSSEDTKKTYVRTSAIETKESQCYLSMLGENDVDRGMDVSISMPGGTPVVIKTERDRKTNMVVSKTIVSGQVNSTIDRRGKMTITYKNLKVNFADRSCSIGSGTASIVVYDEKRAEVKTLTLGSKSKGGRSLKDSSGKDLDGFSLDRCDLEDLMN